MPGQSARSPSLDELLIETPRCHASDPSNADFEIPAKRCAAKHQTISVDVEKEVSQGYGKSET